MCRRNQQKDGAADEVRSLKRGGRKSGTEGKLHNGQVTHVLEKDTRKCEGTMLKKNIAVEVHVGVPVGVRRAKRGPFLWEISRRRKQRWQVSV